MSRDIEQFLNKFDELLSNDLILRIIMMVYKEHNLELIRKQKILKAKLNDDILQFFGHYYTDGKIKLYKGINNEIILNNMHHNNCRLYSQNQTNGQTELLIQSDQNQIVLFDNPIAYDSNGLPITKKVKVYIYYM